MANAYNEGTSWGERDEEKRNDGSFFLDKCLHANSGDVLDRLYNKDGRLIGVTILMDKGTIPVTAQVIAELRHLQSLSQGGSVSV